MHKNTLKQNGVKVLSATEFIPQGPEGIILESMLEGYAEYYSAELSQKVKRGMNETRIKGHFTGGRILYGYKVENHKILIDEEKAEVVRFIYEQYSLGNFVVDIVNELQGKGIYYYGKKWCKNTVYNLLKNEKYAGIYRFDGQVFENMYPAIVSREIFEKVRAKSATNNDNGSRSVKVKYLLKNKMKCGYCGRPMSAETGTSQNGEVKHYYKCYGKKNNNGCKKNNIRKDIIENMIIESIMTALSTPHIMNSVINGLLLEQERGRNANSILTAIVSEKRQVDKALENIMNAIEQGIISNTTNKRLCELEERQAELEEQILREQSKQEIIYTEEQLRNYYKELLNIDPQYLIEKVVKEVVLYDDKIDIYFNSPINTSPDDNNRGFSFYSDMRSYNYKDPYKRWDISLTFNVTMRL